MPRLSLKAARVNAELTQKEVAKILNVEEKTVWNWENGKTFPKPPQINALCELYGVKYDYIRFSNDSND